MSITVRHLNGDSTFLLLFSPEPHPTPSDLAFGRGAYSVLIDPWITGSSIINAKWFAVTDRVVPSAISHLSEIEEPDLVICSQNKPDHTHKETLLQLRPEARTIIAAEPGAAKDIKSWNHFDPHRIVSLDKYDPKEKFGNSLRLFIPPLSAEGIPGELVISFIPAKNYMTGLHNAIGITYQAPTRSKALASVTTIDLPRTKHSQSPMVSPISPGTTSPDMLPAYAGHSPVPVYDSQETIVPVTSPGRKLSGKRPQLSRTSNSTSSELLSFPYPSAAQPVNHDEIKQDKPHPNAIPTFNINDTKTNDFYSKGSLPTPPESPNSAPRRPIMPMDHSIAFTPKPTISGLPLRSISPPQEHSRILSDSEKPLSVYVAKPKAISVLYTPHGIATSDLHPYVKHHLVRLPGALPLTLLLHSFEYAQNPWYLGGNIMTGAIGGIDIAKALMARCWISAHDEKKEKKGVSVMFLKQENMSIDEIRRELARDEMFKRYGWMCDVRTLACGKQMRLSASERDLLVGAFSNGVRQGLGIDCSASGRQPTVDAGG